MSIEAMKQALEVLEQINQFSIGENAIALPGEIDGAMDNLRAAIEQAEKRKDWQETYGKIIKALAQMCRISGSDELFDLGGIPRDPVMGLVQDIRVAIDEYDALRQEHYDQTSLELCNECGWKAIIPGDGCLVCARQNAKPVAYVDERIHGWPDCFVMEPDPPHTIPLYTEPREWVGLTEREFLQAVNWDDALKYYLALPNFPIDAAKQECLKNARAIEAKLKEKNAA